MTIPPTVDHVPAVELLPHDTRRRYDEVLPIVAANPWITTAEIVKATGHTSPMLFRILKHVRETLGILPGIGSGSGRIENRARYEAACKAMGVQPVAENVGPTRPPGTAKERNGGDRGQKGRSPARTLLEEAVASMIPESKPAPEPEALPSVFPALTASPPSEGAKDTMAALRLLLDAMRAENVAEISISDDGALRMSRRVTVLTTMKL